MSKIYTIILAFSFLLSNSILAQDFSSARLTISKGGDEAELADIIRMYDNEATDFDITQYLNENLAEDLWVTGQFNSNEEIIEILFNSKRLKSNSNGESLKQIISVERIPYLGISTVAEQNFDGVLVEEIFEGGSADKSGLKKGDIITQIGSDLISENCHLAIALNKADIDKRVDIAFLRNGKMKHVRASLDSRIKKKITWNYPAQATTIDTYTGNTEVLKP